MLKNKVTEDDCKGTSCWIQAQEGWGPAITVACSVPHFLRKCLPSQIGPGVTAAKLGMIDRAPRVDPMLLPNQRDATTDDWGPYMI
eukprot:16381592-Heterocapsa_arctica.AAC.1